MKKIKMFRGTKKYVCLNRSTCKFHLSNVQERRKMFIFWQKHIYKYKIHPTANADRRTNVKCGWIYKLQTHCIKSMLNFKIKLKRTKKQWNRKDCLNLFSNFLWKTKTTIWAKLVLSIFIKSVSKHEWGGGASEADKALFNELWKFSIS